jgi:rfaE bifunctional protein nucleotidyltransferase chain/domain
MRHSAYSWQQRADEKIYEPHELAAHLHTLKESNRTIALLNGSFDLLHAGHLHIIYEASKTADILVVALNTDMSVRKYKSPHRPIITLNYRMEMVAALEMVDFVTFFDETDPRELLRLLRPNIHVNGEEYGTNCIEAPTVDEIGATLHLVNRIPGLATSDIIAAIQKIPEKNLQS